MEDSKKFFNNKKENKMKKVLISLFVVCLLFSFGTAQTTIIDFDETASDWAVGMGAPGNVVTLEDNFDDFLEGDGSMEVTVEITDQVSWGTWTDISYTLTDAPDLSGYTEMRFKIKVLKEPTSTERSIQFTCDLYEADGELWRYPEDLDIFYTPNSIITADSTTTDWFEVVVPFSRFAQPSWYSPVDGIVDLSAVSKFAFGVHSDSTANDTVHFLIDDLRATNPLDDGMILSLDESAVNWTVGLGQDHNTVLLEDNFDEMTQGNGSLYVEARLLTPFFSWGTWTDIGYTLDSPLSAGSATELRFDIKMLTPSDRKNFIFTCDIVDGNGELLRWGGDNESPGQYGLFNHVDLAYNDYQWKEIVVPFDDLFTPAWAGPQNGIVDDIASFHIGIHATLAQLNDTTSAAVSDTVAFLLDNVRLTHATEWPLAIDDGSASVPSNYSLSQNYPNPFNPTTSIDFTIENNEEVNLSIYNLNGELVAVLANGHHVAGTHSFVWNGKDNNGISVASDVYIYTLSTGSNTISKRMIFLK